MKLYVLEFVIVCENVALRNSSKMPRSNSDHTAQHVEKDESKVVKGSADIDHEDFKRSDGKVQKDKIVVNEDQAEPVFVEESAKYVSDEEDVLELETEQEEDMFVTLDDYNDGAGPQDDDKADLQVVVEADPKKESESAHQIDENKDPKSSNSNRDSVPKNIPDSRAKEESRRSIKEKRGTAQQILS
jgi:hypothetical protein